MREWSTLKKLMMLKASGAGESPQTYGPDDIVEFTTKRAKKLKELTVTLSPIQDLHGYDSPWPAGGGKNKFYCGTNKSASAHGVTCSFDASTQTFTISGTNDSSSAYILMDVTPTGEISRNVALSRAFIGSPTGVYINFVYYNGSAWVPINNGSSISDTVELSSIRVQVGVLGTVVDIPSTTFKCQIQEGSTAPTVWTPYENLCPIYGRTGASAWRTGKNILRMPTWQELIDCPRTGSYKNYEITVKPNTTYYLSTTYKQGYTPPSTFVLVATNTTNSNWKSIVHSSQGIVNGSMTSGADGKLYLNCYADTLNETSWNGIVDNVETQLEEGSAATDYEPYSGNLFSVVFPALGANQWDEEWEVGGINVLGDKYATSDRIRSKNYIPVKPGTAYYRATPNNIQPFFYDANKTFISYGYWNTGSFTTPENAYFAMFQVDPAYGTTYGNNIAINYPSTVTTYEPYTTTLYSGMLDFVTGNGVADMAIKDLGTLTWFALPVGGDNGNRFYSSDLSDAIKIPASVSETPYLVCSMYKAKQVSQYNQAVDGITVHPNGSVQIYDSTKKDMSADDFKTAMSGVQLCYELATPITFHVDPQTIMALKGSNTIWSPDGTVTVIARV